MPNRLSTATSPYLQQHAHQPVDWLEWSDETLAEARAADRPILLSIGYATCHWCHVMAHESFDDPAIADLMNERFVSIKVDREERPDIDTLFQHALSLLGEQGGWPLTMFLTPAGEPFWGGTYFPPQSRWGRPAFADVLRQISKTWSTERQTIDSGRAVLVGALQRLGMPSPGPLPGPELAIETARSLAEEFDTVHGGIGGPPKFPRVPTLELLRQVAVHSDDETIRQRVLQTVRRMCQGGIFDHLGGGFARYSVDAAWLVPHFEKMLYDNAQMLELLGRAWIETGDPLFRARARETVDWLLREMRVEGAFAAALDADSEGEEGKFYLWEAEEIGQVLGAAAAPFALAYGVTRSGNHEKKDVLNRLHEPGLPAPDEEPFLAAARAKLLEARDRRPRPFRDDKVLTDWNGLLVAALARTGRIFGEPGWILAAKEAFAAIVAHSGNEDRLIHGYRDGRHLDMAFLDDYAQMIRAGLALHEIDGDPASLAMAERWLDWVDHDFSHPSGGYHLAPAEADLLVRPARAHDGPSPAAVGTIVIESVRLGCLTGAQRHFDRARRVLEAFAGEVRLEPVEHATMLVAAMFLRSPLQIVVVGEPETAETRAMLRAIVNLPMPERAFVLVPPDTELPAEHPAAGKRLVGGVATAYVCAGPTCLEPARHPAELPARIRAAMALGRPSAGE